MKYGEIGERCWAGVPCSEVSTHILTTQAKVNLGDAVHEMTVESAYCLDHALYFAAWLPYCYPGEYELVSIMPPASELFGREVLT